MKYIFTLLTALCFISMPLNYAHAQRNNRVEVKKNFEGDLTAAKKSKSKIILPDSLKNVKLDFDYSILDRKYQDLYEFSPLPSARLNNKMMAEYPAFVAKAGMFYPLSPSVAIFFQPNLNGTSSYASDALTIKAGHDSYWDKNKTAIINSKKVIKNSGKKSYARNWNNHADIAYSNDWRTGALAVDAYYRNVNDSYYALDVFAPDEIFTKSFIKDHSNHTFNQVGVNFNINSVDDGTSRALFHYKFNVNYSNTTDKADLTTYSPPTPMAADSYLKYDEAKLNESYIKATLEGGPAFGKYSMLTVGVTSETAFYSKVQDYRHSLLDIYVTYKFEKGDWALNLGGNFSLDFNNKKGGDGKHNYLSPRADITYTINPDRFWAYAIVSGGNDLNNYSSLLSRSPWISPLADMRTTAIPINAKIGLKGSFSQTATFNFYGGYVKRKGMVEFYIPSHIDGIYSPALEVIYSKRTQIYFGGAVDLKTQYFSIGADARYSMYNKTGITELFNRDKKRPLCYTPFEANAYAEFNVRERIYVGVNALIHGKTPQFCRDVYIKSPAYANVSAYAQYVVNNNFTVFAQVSNMLNSTIVNQGMYIERGIGAGVGVLVKF